MVVVTTWQWQYWRSYEGLKNSKKNAKTKAKNKTKKQWQW
jgi:hypothetical protein